VGLLTQPVDPTASGELVLFQQSNNRRHPRSPRERQHDRPRLPRNHHAHTALYPTLTGHVPVPLCAECGHAEDEHEPAAAVTEETGR
ncbi:hypothetical protein ACFVRD_41785, partial [Streptomyces sp. NPDC057908]|uniref:hypothetical protein n=1 Tax=Streptomyces sp. NPDC057908 TaxID=3346276 RepID=UPI0036E1BF86